MGVANSLHDTIRDAPLGQIIRFVTKNRLFKYPEEHLEFELPAAWNQLLSNADHGYACHTGTETPSTIVNPTADQNTIEGLDIESKALDTDGTTDAAPNATENGVILVDWYSDQDPANPQNWSNLRRALVGLIICFYTFVVYLSSAIYSPSTEGVMERFGVSNLEATLGLAIAYAVTAKGWRWSLYESIWVSAPVLIALFVCMPETSASNILLRRAQRLRRSAGSQRLQSQSEIDQAHLTVSGIAVDALIKPLEITIKDPAVLFVQIYSAILYAIYYSFFPVYYDMSTGEVGLVFICIAVGCILAIILYGLYLYYVLIPRMKKSGIAQQEEVLSPGLAACFGPTIGLFIFAWTARVSIHWIVPVIGVTIYAGSIFTVLQVVFLYVPMTYPQYAASLFAANDFFRSALASGSILFAHPLYKNLGFAKGTSLLGGLSVIGIFGMWVLFFYGAKLRALSKFAT
uniref:Caffeine resistance protein 5 n=1 Tax=Fusarium oxysporum (strain Fo5176) TaxID=660025 RepID=A0A0D2YAW8_FUSOF